MHTAPLKTFIIYARTDAPFKDELLIHLHPFVENGLLQNWTDSDLLPGEEWEKRIEAELEAAHLVLMLVSADALRSEFIRKKELKTALEKKRAGNARVVPILVRDCMWQLHPDLSELQLLPKNGTGSIQGVAAWLSRDSAWTSVCTELLALVQELRTGLEKEAAERARLAAAEAQRLQQAAEQEKAERARHRRDEAFWKKVLAGVGQTEELAQRFELYDSYLQEPDFQNHRAEAVEAAGEIEAEIEAVQKLEAAKEAMRRKQEAAKAAEALRQQEAAEAARKLEAARAAERRKQEAAKVAEAQRRLEAAEAEAARAKGLPDMILVKGGTFKMGSNDISTAEKPVHAVTLSDFAIGKYPVTQRLWREIMGNNPSNFKNADDCPVESVSWDDVQEFLKKLNARFPGQHYRLPTEAEWEFAARGGTLSKGFQYAGSNNLDEVAWHSGNSGGRTQPVGQKKANELGLHDMSGNVWEWCADWYGAYPSGYTSNPPGPKSGTNRVSRGGGWRRDARRCRVASRSYRMPDHRFRYLGFRLASSPQ